MKRFRVNLNGRSYTVDVDDPRAGRVTARLDGETYEVELDGSGVAAPETLRVPVERSKASGAAGASQAGTSVSGPQLLTAPIPGKIASVVAVAGQMVARGDALLTIEAMKMFNVIRAPWAGKIVAVHVADGAQVVQGQRLVSVQLT